VSGFHSNSSPKVDPSFDGTASLMPHDWIPQQSSRITYKGKYKNVDAALISWGAWSWGDSATWHFDESKERPAVDAGWELCKQNKQTFIVRAAVAVANGRFFTDHYHRTQPRRMVRVGARRSVVSWSQA